jgi:hypothetical protein
VDEGERICLTAREYFAPGAQGNMVFIGERLTGFCLAPEKNGESRAQQ